MHIPSYHQMLFHVHAATDEQYWPSHLQYYLMIPKQIKQHFWHWQQLDFSEDVLVCLETILKKNKHFCLQGLWKRKCLGNYSKTGMLISNCLLMCHTYLYMLPHLFSFFFLLPFTGFIFLYCELFRAGIVPYEVCKKKLLENY